MTNNTTIPSEQMDNTVSDEQLPPLPEPATKGTFPGPHGYSCEDMRAYAVRALLALKAEQPAALSDQDAALVNQAHDMLLAYADDQRSKGNDCAAMGAECSADAVLRLGAAASVVDEQPAAQGEPLGYNDIFRAIQAATKAPYKGAVEVSVQAFTEAIGPLYRHPSPAAQVPEGWQLVPIEPTPEMLQEGLNRKARSLWADGRTPFRPSTANLRPAQEVAAIQWAAMLSASPKPPEPCDHRWCPFGDQPRWRCVKCDTPAPVIGRPPEPHVDGGTLEANVRTLLNMTPGQFVARDISEGGAEDIRGSLAVTWTNLLKVAESSQPEPQAVLQAVDAVLKDALDGVTVHPCDEHNDEARARGLVGSMLELYRARIGVNQPPAQALLDQVQAVAQMADAAIHQSSDDQRNILQDIAERLTALLPEPPAHVLKGGE